jgi:DnaK suppressor protein
MAVQQSSNDSPYTAEELRPVRDALLRRRHELIEAQEAHDREMNDEAERDSPTEEEEAAAHQHAQFVSARVREGFHREVMEIDAALRRMDAGAYGTCEECEEPIAIERLKVLPYTRLCALDAAMEERQKVVRSPGRSLTL